MSVIDPTTNTVTATINVGTAPHGMAFDGTNIYVTEYGDDTVSVIDPTTNTVTATIDVGTGHELYLTVATFTSPTDRVTR